MHPYKIQIVQTLKDADKVNRMTFCQQFLDLNVNEDIIHNMLLSDEAHHLSGPVNKETGCSSINGTSTDNDPVKRKLQDRRITTVPVSDYESDEIELENDVSDVLSIFTDSESDVEKKTKSVKIMLKAHSYMVVTYEEELWPWKVLEVKNNGTVVSCIQHHEAEISNKFAALGSFDEIEEELHINSVWENIIDIIKIAPEQSISYYETKKKKQWFDEDYSMIVERRKQAKLKFLQDPVDANRDNYEYFNERREASCSTLRKKERLLEGKTE
ncbi:hypothetical protein ANN_08617 [Periplaneta americana]|uniref:Uncharacterized protein n=1 Tax=Periplaneta americana TaxID=6978 RepID=A0ABQ8T3B5_PERAM|nr:hypothetical protein ANN_08617 [Periplaneta americana]